MITADHTRPHIHTEPRVWGAVVLPSPPGSSRGGSPQGPARWIGHFGVSPQQGRKVISGPMDALERSTHPQSCGGLSEPVFSCHQKLLPSQAHPPLRILEPEQTRASAYRGGSVPLAALCALSQVDSRMEKCRGAERRGQFQWAMLTIWRAVLSEIPGHQDTVV